MIVDCTVIVFVYISDDVLKLFLAWIQSKLLKNVLQFRGVNLPRVVVVKKLPGLLDLVLLFGAEMKFHN